MRKVIKVINSTITAALVVVLCLNMYFVFAKTVLKNDMPRLLGYSSAVVVSSSMAPAIETDDFVVLKMQADYNTGDIVTYRTDDKLVTHRIVEKTAQGYITKGDSPSVIRDEEIHQSQIVGKAIKVIPKVGKVLNELKTPAGILAIILIGALIFEFPQFLDILKKRKETETGTGTALGGESCGNQ